MDNYFNMLTAGVQGPNDGDKWSLYSILDLVEI